MSWRPSGWVCPYCGPGECGKDREEAEAKAAEAWNRRAATENRVLTLEEAAESGDPVWLGHGHSQNRTDISFSWRKPGRVQNDRPRIS